MGNEIGCIIDMFSSNAEVIYPNNTKENVPFVGVLEYLYHVCQDENIFTLHFYGNKKYIEGLIEKYPPLNYGCGKVEIKVN